MTVVASSGVGNRVDVDVVVIVRLWTTVVDAAATVLVVSLVCVLTVVTTLVEVQNTALFLLAPSKRAGAAAAVSMPRFLTVSATGYTDLIGVRPGGAGSVLVGGSISSVKMTTEVVVSTGVSVNTVVSSSVDVTVMSVVGCEAVVVATSV